jgi:hypothetical protein
MESREVDTRGVHSLLYIAYTCILGGLVKDIGANNFYFIGGYYFLLSSFFTSYHYVIFYFGIIEKGLALLKIPN